MEAAGLDFAGRTMRSILLCYVLFSAVRTGSEPIRVTRETLRRCDVGTQNFCFPLRNVEAPIVDFVPENVNNSGRVRVRKALQCLDGAELAAYAEKLYRAYELMRALPDDDPRSLYQQNNFHNTLGFGDLFQDGTELPIFVHYNWLTGPWHRFFIYFHERMLRSLLQDPGFTLHFWNFDNFVDGSNSSRADGCYKVGHYVPTLYADPSKSTYQGRSDIAKDPTAVVDLTLLTSNDSIVRRSDDETIAINRGIMYSTMITQGQSRRAFMGADFRKGDSMTIENHMDRIGSLENTHLSVTHWLSDRQSGGLHARGLDPLFYAYHVGIDRLWGLWSHLETSRSLPTDDADFMDAEFLFYDENKLLSRVKVKQCLSSETLGYTYERVNDENWIDFQTETLTDAQLELVNRMKVKGSSLAQMLYNVRDEMTSE